MARYKKRPSFQPGLPGLFDDIDSSFRGADEAFEVRRAPKEEPSGEKPRQELWADGDAFSPLETSATVDRLQFISFGSGSSGNCAYLGDDQSGFLIDAGIDDTKVVAELQRNGIDMRKVSGIILTHDHSDHVRYVYKLVRKYRHMEIFCTPKTLNGLLRRHAISNRIKDYHRAIYKEHPFKLGNFTLLAFEVQHDGTDNAGFYITNGRHHMVVATDLGCISDRADFYMRQANYLMIEANYDETMLTTGPYPEYLKARIRNDNGHLNNEVTASYLAGILTPNLRQIFLCHLSHENNTPEIALRAVEQALLSTGITAVGDGSGSPTALLAPVQLLALPRFTPTGLITLR